MKSCNRAFFSVLLFVVLFGGCTQGDLTAPITSDPLVVKRTVLPSSGTPGTPDETFSIAPDGSASWCCTWWSVDLGAVPGETIGRVSIPTSAAAGDSVLLGLAVTREGVDTFITPNRVATGLTTTNMVPSTPYVVQQGDVIRVVALAFSGGSTSVPAQYPATMGPVSANPAIATTARNINKSILLTDVVATSGSVGATTVIPVPSLGVTAGDAATFYVRFPDLPSDDQISGVTLGFSNVNSRANTTVSIASTGTGDPASFTFADVPGSTLLNVGSAQKAITGLSLIPSGGQVFYLKVSTGTSGWGSGTLTSMSIGVNAP